MQQTDKITIVEGPAPTFELSSDAWVLGLTEGPFPGQIFHCQLRTFDGPALIDRCHRAWHSNQAINLEYRDNEGLPQQVQIVAVRWMEIPEGHVLLTWVFVDQDRVEFELGSEVDDADNEFDDLDATDFDLTL